MIMRVDITDGIAVPTNRKINRKMGMCDGKGLPVAETVTVVSETENI